MKEWSGDEDHSLSRKLLIAMTDQAKTCIVVSHHHKMHLITLIFGIVLLPKAFTLKCYKCIPGESKSCVDTEKVCSSKGYQCATLKITSYVGTSRLGDVHVKTCVLDEQCVESSVNFGTIRYVISSHCCTTDLCNTERAPDHSVSRPNGKKCYRCDGIKCSTTLNCVANEDYCISKTVNTKDGKKTLKGCASEQICSRNNAQIQAAIGGEITCCQGDLCNSASGTRAGLLLLVAPLVSLAILA